MSSDHLPYTWGDMQRQTLDWDRAAAALRAGDADAIVEAMACPVDRGDSVLYADVLSRAALGACLTAAAAVRAHGGDEAPVGHRWIWEAHVVDQSKEPSAVDRVAVQSMIAAANGRYDQVLDLIMGYSRPDQPGIQRLADLTMTLLRLYVEYSGMEATT